MEIILDDTNENITEPDVPSINRVSENCQYKKSDIIEIKNTQPNSYKQYNSLQNMSHIISPQDYDTIVEFRQTVTN